jgi:hypothetical protein
MTAQELFDQAFNVPRDPRSAQYKQGCLYIIRLKLGECRSEPCPYPIGTAHADAWLFGAEEGHKIYNRYRFDSEQKT